MVDVAKASVEYTSNIWNIKYVIRKICNDHLTRV